VLLAIEVAILRRGSDAQWPTLAHLAKTYTPFPPEELAVRLKKIKTELEDTRNRVRRAGRAPPARQTWTDGGKASPARARTPSPQKTRDPERTRRRSPDGTRSPDKRRRTEREGDNRATAVDPWWEIHTYLEKETPQFLQTWIGASNPQRPIGRTDTRDAVEGVLREISRLTGPSSTRAAGRNLLQAVTEGTRRATFKDDLVELKHYTRLWIDSEAWIRACRGSKDQRIEQHRVCVGTLNLGDDTLTTYTRRLIEGKLRRQEEQLHEFCTAPIVKGTLHGANIRLSNLDYRHIPKAANRDEELARDAHRAITQLTRDLEVCLNRAGTNNREAAKLIRKEIESTGPTKVALSGPLAIYANLVVFALFQGEWNSELDLSNP